MIGGVCVHTGTIPSKTVREAIFQLTGFAVKALYGNGFRKGDISLQDVSFRVNAVISRETEVIRAQLRRNDFAAEIGLAQAQLNELVGLVLIYRNLGGGWQQ